MMGWLTLLAAGCSSDSIFGFPNWHKGLNKVVESDGTCSVKLSGLDDIWKIAANLIVIGLRVAGLVALGFIIYGGITYITSGGSPDRNKQAIKIMTNAIVGLVLAVLASFIVSFVASIF